MKTTVVKFHSIGGPEVLKLEEETLAPLKADEVLIRNFAIGINYIDTYVRTGLYQTSLPSTLGYEGSGVVEAVGPHVTHLKPGDRVAYCQGPLGAYATFRNMPGNQVVKIPDGISFEIAAASMLKGLTVQYLFTQTYQVKQDEVFLFHAAAGGVGLIACQFAKHLGAKLIGTVSSDEKAKLAKSHGAWATINYTTENIPQKVMELNQGQKLNVVYDSVGKNTWEASLDCLRPRGLMVSFGNASGAITGVNLGILAQKGSLYLTRPQLGAYVPTLETLSEASSKFFSLVGKGIIKVDEPQSFNLADVRKAHEVLQSRERVGSLILKV